MSLPLLTYVESGPFKFLIMDAPRTSNLSDYLREMKKRHVTDIVRVCEEETYKPEIMEKNNIETHVRTSLHPGSFRSLSFFALSLSHLHMVSHIFFLFTRGHRICHIRTEPRHRKRY